MKLTQLSDIKIKTLGYALLHVNPLHPRKFLADISYPKDVITKFLSKLLAQGLQYAVSRSCGNRQ